MPSASAFCRGRVALSADRQVFEIQFSDYFPELVGRVKAVPGRRYLPDIKLWQVPALPPGAALVLGLVDGQGVQCPEDVWQYARLTHHNGWGGLGGALWPFQREGVRAALGMKRCFIADEPGLGKTVEALAVLNAAQAFPALVVCPLSLKRHWQRETERWLPGRTVGLVEKHAPLPRVDVLIVHYDILDHCASALTRLGLKAAVFDESQYLKNRAAQRTQAALKVVWGIPYRLALTATPVLNRPSELLAQLDVLDQLPALGGFWAFARRYCAARRGRGALLNGASNLAELNRKLRAACYLRRAMAEVLADLPAKRRLVAPMEIVNRAEYAQAESDLMRGLLQAQAEFHARLPGQPVILRDRLRRKWDDDVAASAGRAASVPVQVDFLKRLAALGKLPAVIAWVEDFLATGEKLVLFAWHQDVLARLAEHFAAPDIAGDTPPAQRQDLVDRFQADPACRLLVLSLNTGSLGLALTAAAHVAFVELAWTPAVHAQAEDRLHRLSQTRPVTAWYLLAADTIDDDLYDLLERKRAVVDGATDGDLRGALIARLRQRAAAEPALSEMETDDDPATCEPD